MSTVSVTAKAPPVSGVVRVPGSKSIANRALICAFLADGQSTVTGIPDGDDTSVILDVMSSVGRIAGAGDTWVVSGSRTVTLPGIIDAQLAGTSSRFLTAVASLSLSTSVIDGGAPLRSRPMDELHGALQQLGANVESLGELGHLPVSVSRGHMSGGEISIRGDVSSQFISSLMLIGPLLDGGVTLTIDGDLVSRSYVEMTAAVMRTFGATVDVLDNRVSVHAGSYSATDYEVEPDFSSAAFPLVVPVLVPGSVRVPGLARSVLQGDAALLDILRRIGCDVVISENDVEVRRAPNAPLSPVTLEMSDCSDLVPAVAVALAGVPGESRITGVGFIRNKESDRLGDLANEMMACGVDIETTDDGLIVRGHSRRTTCSVATHHDHRLAMSLSLLALLNDEVIIGESGVVSKSWPSYFSDMEPILTTTDVQN